MAGTGSNLLDRRDRPAAYTLQRAYVALDRRRLKPASINQHHPARQPETSVTTSLRTFARKAALPSKPWRRPVHVGEINRTLNETASWENKYCASILLKNLDLHLLILLF
jgi:hypothetical protein